MKLQYPISFDVSGRAYELWCLLQQTSLVLGVFNETHTKIVNEDAYKAVQKLFNAYWAACETLNMDLGWEESHPLCFLDFCESKRYQPRMYPRKEFTPSIFSRSRGDMQVRLIDQQNTRAT